MAIKLHTGISAALATAALTLGLAACDTTPAATGPVDPATAMSTCLDQLALDTPAPIVAPGAAAPITFDDFVFTNQSEYLTTAQITALRQCYDQKMAI
ncbi:hypothetical protein [Chachezhania sediminis]|uniref:hypothetical protein n=1 Tax=Chachezhania sediminis TaxID=2599291 RepID=UPI00131A62E5|nr:hypothetical protein [Chachezhania sediminis]